MRQTPVTDNARQNGFLALVTECQSYDASMKSYELSPMKQFIKKAIILAKINDYTQNRTNTAVLKKFVQQSFR
jgi:hypothetical protein